ncbi:alpha/beta hydrolase family protein [Marinobacter xestospongiae]|uniref:Alpha/beta fold hydrolase n=1 Tax=Marinobacter xestospongiae TaxID=994319 RepID=A0ABU3W4R9_9GAMM|nr:alpha/beta fold hydrolase [Marinobacter xestospongiae]MDV2081182.1 alpha/beta fold hydrolase [Marinobacter xestospongiae]
MKKTVLSALLLFSQACLGDIGLAVESYEDTTRARTLEATVMYPTSAVSPKQRFAENAAFYGFTAIEDAVVTGHQLPVYILVHGTSGNWRNLSWLASQLAERGALVVSANHPGYTSGQATPDSVIRMWDQPLDVSFLIDNLLSGPYGPYADPKNITVIGYSLGGYSALALAGARFDIAGYHQYCEGHQDVSCQYFANALTGLTDGDRSKISENYRDTRVAQAIALAPGYVPAVQADSLRALSASTLIIGAELDERIPPALQLKPYLEPAADRIRYREIAGAYHFSFMQICKPEAEAILAEEGAAFVCQERSDHDREQFHTQLQQLIEEFDTL